MSAKNIESLLAILKGKSREKAEIGDGMRILEVNRTDGKLVTVLQITGEAARQFVGELNCDIQGSVSVLHDMLEKRKADEQNGSSPPFPAFPYLPKEVQRVPVLKKKNRKRRKGR